MKYALFLRGINVGGIKVPMAELHACLEALGLQHIKTFLQTGNVVFESQKSQAELKPAIEKALNAQFHYEAFVLLYPADVLQGIVDAYPFTADANMHRYIVFCADQATIDELMAYRPRLDTKLEDIAAGKHVIYWRVPVGSTLGTTFSKLMAKPKYKAVITTRNLNTIQKMV